MNYVLSLKYLLNDYENIKLYIIIHYTKYNIIITQKLKKLYLSIKNNY